MSGPKTSRYTLTPEQRRILEEQRRISVEREILAKQQGDIRSVIAEADRVIERLEPLCAESGVGAAVLAEAKELCKKAKDTFGKASSASDKVGSDRLRELNQSLKTATRELATATKKAAEEYETAEKAFRSVTAERIDAGFDLLCDMNDVGEISFSEKILSGLRSLSDLSISDELKAKMAALQAKFTEIGDLDFLKSFYEMSVLPFMKECRAYHSAYIAYGDEYEQKVLIYEANAKRIGITTEKIPFSEASIAILDAKIEETEEIIRQKEEQEYISRCVDEAMREMGYSVAGNREVVRRNGNRFRNELYLFDEGTAVNVTYSDEGQITMELGGIGMDDRMPTEAESASLVSDMQTFCDDYHEIEQLLLKKGIVTKRISVLPPEAQYAQIINVSDYDMSAEVSEYRARGKKKKTGEAASQKVGE